MQLYVILCNDISCALVHVCVCVFVRQQCIIQKINLKKKKYIWKVNMQMVDEWICGGGLRFVAGSGSDFKIGKRGRGGLWGCGGVRGCGGKNQSYKN